MAWATSTYIAAAALILGAAASAGGTAYSAEAQRKASNYNADVAEANARAAEKKAAFDERMFREEQRKILARQRAIYGKAALSPEGSPLLVMEDTTKQTEIDAMAIRYGGDVAASRERSEANLHRMQGKATRTAGYITAGSTLLTGLGSAASLKR